MSDAVLFPETVGIASRWRHRASWTLPTLPNPELESNHRGSRGGIVGRGGRIISDNEYSTSNGNKYDAPGPNGRLVSVINSLH